MDDRGVPQDRELERCVVGALLDPWTSVEAAPLILARLTAEDLWQPHLREVFAEVAARHERGEVHTAGALADKFPIAGLLEIAEVSDRISSWHTAVDRIAGLATARELLRTFTDGTTQVYDGVPVGQVAERAQQRISEAAEPRTGDPVAVQWGDVADWSEAMSPWLIDGLLRRGHRMILVASEGAGKTLCLRQLALKASAGLHPFIAGRKLSGGPVRSLTVDLENPRDQIRSHGRWIMSGLQRELGADFDPRAMPAWLVDWPGRIDLRARRDRMRLEAEIRACRPDLVVIGPLYRAFRRKSSESEEEAVGEVTEILDDLRVRYGLTMCFEHHAPHASGGGKRDMRPTGSSYWLRWPEFGLSLSKEKTGPTEPNRFRLGRWRGDRVKATWPEFLDWGREYPFTGIYPTGTLNREYVDDDEF